MSTNSPNLAAFLAMLRHSEGTDRAGDPWAVVFGFAFTIVDFSDHPACLGWPGVVTKYGHTTAAGAYQFEKATWLGCKHALGLPDFGQESQDAAATLLIRQAGALDLIEQGQIEAAIGKCGHLWASLPSSTSGQPEAALASLIGAYANAGGAVA